METEVVIFHKVVVPIPKLVIYRIPVVVLENEALSLVRWNIMVGVTDYKHKTG